MFEYKLLSCLVLLYCFNHIFSYLFQYFYCKHIKWLIQLNNTQKWLETTSRGKCIQSNPIQSTISRCRTSSRNSPLFVVNFERFSVINANNISRIKMKMNVFRCDWYPCIVPVRVRIRGFKSKSLFARGFWLRGNFPYSAGP